MDHSEIGSVAVGISQERADMLFVAEQCVCQIDSNEPRMAQIRARQVCTGQCRLLQLCPDERGSLQLCMTKDGSPQPRLTECGSIQVRFTEIGTLHQHSRSKPLLFICPYTNKRLSALEA